MREDGVISEHSLWSLLLDTANCGRFLPQHLVQVLHDLQLLSPLILLPCEVPPPLGSPLYWWGTRCWGGSWSLGSVLTLIPPTLYGHPLRFTKNKER